MKRVGVWILIGVGFFAAGLITGLKVKGYGTHRRGKVLYITDEINGTGTRDGEQAFIMRDDGDQIFYCIVNRQLILTYYDRANYSSPGMRARLPSNGERYACPRGNVRAFGTRDQTQ